MKTIFFDVDTQLDFLYPAGALAVPGAQDIFKSIGELTRFAAADRIQVISTADAHSEDDPEFKTWNPHCVIGTTGQQKAAGTLLERRLTLSTRPGAINGLHSQLVEAPQIIIEKQKIDCFTNPNLRPLLDVLNADRYVVYGVVTELCVQCAAFGLLSLGAQVELVTDAIKSLSAPEERAVLRRFEGEGGRLTTLSALRA